MVTNVETGRAEYIRLEHAMEQMDVIRASASMPFVSKPVKLGGKLYLDGGVADSIPFKAAEKLGFDRVVVILTRDRRSGTSTIPRLWSSSKTATARITTRSASY